jgi:tRNA modification GTPase
MRRHRCSQAVDDRGGVAPTATGAALLTPPGRGALAVVGVAGEAAVGILARLFVPRGSTPLAERPAGTVSFGAWRSAADVPAEDVVVLRRGPREFEIHCHGGLAAADAVLASLERHGCRRRPWTDWLLDGGAGQVEVEARDALSRAGGPKAARILARQLAGSLQAELARLDGLLRAGCAEEANATIDGLLRASRVGLRLTRPWRVVVAGPTNAGKSSLVNAVAGYARAIVSPQPGTTRDLLETRIVLDGWEVELVDTAGLRAAGAAAAAGGVEKAGIERAIAACGDADLVLRVHDGTLSPPVAAPPAGEMPVFSKADLAGDAAIHGGDALWTSAVTGRGIDELVARVVRRLVPEAGDQPALLAGAVPFTPRQVRLIEGMRPATWRGSEPRA